MEQSTKVVTGKVRFSYANVFEPTAMSDKDTPKYNVSILIPKSDTETLEKIKKAIEAAKQAGKAKLADKNGKIPADAALKMPLRDGDIERPDDEAYAGHFFINANSSKRPSIVNKDLQEIISRDEFYSGCYGRASISFYAFNVNSKGIACGLNNLQKLEDGEPLAGGSSAQEDFGGENAWEDPLM